MDVGAPSNYERISAMYTLEEVRELFASYWLDDEGTSKAIKDCNSKTGYIIDPHGAVGYQAWNDIRKGALDKLTAGVKNPIENPGLTPNLPSWANEVINKQAVGIILETAHPAKFGDIVKSAIGRDPVMPDRLEKVLSLPNNAIPMENNYDTFKSWLIENL